MLKNVVFAIVIVIAGCASPADRAVLMSDIPQNCGVSQMVRADSGYVRFGLFQAEFGRQTNYQCQP